MFSFQNLWIYSKGTGDYRNRDLDLEILLEVNHNFQWEWVYPQNIPTYGPRLDIKGTKVEEGE